MTTDPHRVSIKIFVGEISKLFQLWFSISSRDCSILLRCQNAPYRGAPSDASYQQNGWSAAAGRIALVLNERTGNIWMMPRSGTR
jgi:hypothetical protein